MSVSLDRGSRLPAAVRISDGVTAFMASICSDGDIAWPRNSVERAMLRARCSVLVDATVSCPMYWRLASLSCRSDSMLSAWRSMIPVAMLRQRSTSSGSHP